MSVHGHCNACGDLTRIDHRSGLCEWCEDEVDRIRDPLWEEDGSVFLDHPVTMADSAGFVRFLHACRENPQ